MFAADTVETDNGHFHINNVYCGGALSASDRAKVCNVQRSVRRCSAKQKPIAYAACAPFAAEHFCLPLLKQNPTTGEKICTALSAERSCPPLNKAEANNEYGMYSASCGVLFCSGCAAHDLCAGTQSGQNRRKLFRKRQQTAKYAMTVSAICRILLATVKF